MITENGVVEKDKNPFSCNFWIEQGCSFTEGRSKKLQVLIGLDEPTIRRGFSTNDGTYVAFVAIRWGYAKMVNGKLEYTSKWVKEHGV